MLMALTLGQVAAPMLGCKTPRPPPRWQRFTASGAVVVVTARADAAFVEPAVRAALPRLEAFGLALAHTVEVRVHGGVAAFVRATGQSDGWVRAWSTYDVVHLLPTRYWREDSELARVERLTHELTHVASFHALGPEEEARRIGVPFWFREGSASVVAGQAARRMPLEMLAARAGERDPLRDPPDAASAYAAAHHAMAALARAHGDGVFARMLAAAREDGAPGALERALTRATALTLDELWPLTRSALADG
jgi:hypothetical protein